ncbi:DUF4810 domain-containing protein [Bordetella sp. 15P40C-2]|uniref:DUF4810 domain-containing protein n=1 Tax=Bordetella sp. 15P40C-2 TaxID=2572246 RepID=UPI001327590E|nr:DUF4810 domain-containing protein [Bordetella sp. 15P40C-2]MVW72590.1 DUF4810 domain-containing protein [Bordetella sp. 15P40C-2]
MSNLFNAVQAPACARAGFLRSSMKLAMAGATLSLLAACAQQPQHMYTWESYQPAVYAYLKEPDNDAAAQIQKMEHNIETARASNKALPPGFRGHLAMLYLKVGQDGKAIEQMEDEKAAFPESAPFMDFLMRNLKPQSQASAPPAAAENPAPAVSETTNREGGV